MARPFLDNDALGTAAEVLLHLTSWAEDCSTMEDLLTNIKTELEQAESKDSLIVVFSHLADWCTETQTEGEDE